MANRRPMMGKERKRPEVKLTVSKTGRNGNFNIQDYPRKSKYLLNREFLSLITSSK